MPPNTHTHQVTTMKKTNTPPSVIKNELPPQPQLMLMEVQIGTIYLEENLILHSKIEDGDILKP